MNKYSEIFALYEFCKENGIECRIIPLYDGHRICFRDGSNFTQCEFSFLAASGYIEPAIEDEEHDYTPVSLEYAKDLALKYRNKLNGTIDDRGGKLNAQSRSKGDEDPGSADAGR